MIYFLDTATDEELAEVYSSFFREIVCTDDNLRCKELSCKKQVLVAEIVDRFMRSMGYVRNDCWLWVKAGNIENNGECAARERRAESEVDNDNQSKNRTESKGFDT